LACSSDAWHTAFDVTQVASPSSVGLAEFVDVLALPAQAMPRRIIVRIAVVAEVAMVMAGDAGEGAIGLSFS
jgi:hypothetical protein